MKNNNKHPHWVLPFIMGCVATVICMQIWAIAANSNDLYIDEIEQIDKSDVDEMIDLAVSKGFDAGLQACENNKIK